MAAFLELLNTVIRPTLRQLESIHFHSFEPKTPMQ